jgi:hypothetical protein
MVWSPQPVLDLVRPGPVFGLAGVHSTIPFSMSQLHMLLAKAGCLRKLARAGVAQRWERP